MPAPLRYALDVALVAWVAAWIAVGVSVAHQVEGLTRLSDTVSNVSAPAVNALADASASAARAPTALKTHQWMST